MKRINLNALFTLICLIFCALKMGAQYATPGTGVSWNFNDLTTNSGGAVTQNDNIFTVHQNITISATDTLKISSDIIVKIGADIQLIVDGAGAYSDKQRDRRHLCGQRQHGCRLRTGTGRAGPGGRDSHHRARLR